MEQYVGLGVSLEQTSICVVDATGKTLRQGKCASTPGLSQDWGSGGDGHWRIRVVGWLELLSKAGNERAIVDGAPNLQQQIGTASRPAHLL